ncbi:MAG: hypothetical protein DDT22_00932 [candidate division WS2 bacterium]|uniref:Uncharacterized protein n=1 Tax=Candidatus Hakubella thermalkaliphila TaxID=2754717 RepID=A0A6V8P7N6_9ACTN|nr:hypothetical protein [Candidatus Hakubella thermalkaliphila]MBT9164709.1 hypothetical protein [Candidatus Lithacetigena glycinireducens]MBT9175258.1 hypothetical protein [Candidatus Lithacetigena glycinireducens]GFP27654.1 hypothetical protein HKBW3S33_01065 [Candidatus Hakubella thermalkaliphila]GFP42416.1 hypothetical protein HKBW3C_01542 [Candidatus Hakubella thermalkaliphila]
MIYFECKSDGLLLKVLGIPKNEMIHSGGKSLVCKDLEKHNGFKGLIDEDPHTINPHIKNLKLIENSNEFSIKIMVDNKNNNKIIILCPELERWVIKATEKAGLDIKDFNLPNNGKQLHSVINANLKKFESLLKKLKDKSQMMKALEYHIKGD